MKRSIVLCVFSILAGPIVLTGNAEAQVKAFRQTNLASDVPGTANNISPRLQNSWGLAFSAGQPFFVANPISGAVTVLDAAGLSPRPGSFNVPTADATGADTPTGIVADQNSLFGGRTFVQPFVIATDSGRLFLWGPDAQGNIPAAASLVKNNSRDGSTYKGIAIVTPPGANAAVAVTNFHSGFVEAFLPSFDRVALAGSFTDPNLPGGFAPFGIQVIGNQVFVTYALQDAAKHDPVFGAGNGIVSIFDMDGNFVRRFATGGMLNAPWGIAQASANFGPFGNDILIGNAGDGVINAFDPATGNFVGPVDDGDGNLIVNRGLHALAFRSDGFGDANTLYFSAGINNGQDGLFGSITAGLVSATRLTVQPTQTNVPTPISITVVAAPGNAGTPTGRVTVSDSGLQLAVVEITDGAVTFPQVFAQDGSHHIQALYNGDANFLPSTADFRVEVTGFATRLNLVVPATAAPGSTVTLTATISSADGMPTGNISFLDGNSVLGTVAIDAAGNAALRISTLGAGAHSLTAVYRGDDKFGGSASTMANLTVATTDFTFGAAPGTSTVVAGQATPFMLTITPSGGFASAVTFSCPQITGITCSFNPPTVTPTNGAVSTTLTVSTSASVTHYGAILLHLLGSASLIGGLTIFGVILRQAGKLRLSRNFLIPSIAMVTILMISLVIGGCGGYGSSYTPPNRGTVVLNITATSGAIVHSTTVSVTVQ
jgi:uncharacterized protein (TIGR03118 family)